MTKANSAHRVLETGDLFPSRDLGRRVQMCLTGHEDKKQGKMLLGNPGLEQTTTGCEHRPMPDPRQPDVGVWMVGCGWLH